MLEHHPLIKDFPEHAEAIHSFKESDNHFHKMFNKYDELDKNIFRIEANEEPITDIDLENLKKERLSLKDNIYKIIIDSKATA
jgi:uncharacterized protein YdcH (DUF465 family)